MPVELGMVDLRERADERAHAVGIGHGECRVRGQRAHAFERRRLRNRGLKGEPLVDDQRIVGVAGVEILERLRALRPVVLRRISSAAMRSVMLSAP